MVGPDRHHRTMRPAISTRPSSSPKSAHHVKASRGCPKPSISGQGLCSARHLRRPGASHYWNTPEGHGGKVDKDTPTSGRPWHPCFPQARASELMPENNLLSPDRKGAPWRKSACSAPCRSAPMPPGTQARRHRTAFGCSRWPTAGAEGGLHCHRTLERPLRDGRHE